jgi:hypothetical protein
MELIAQGDAHRTEAAEERVAHCMERLVTAALDRVLVGRGDEDGRRRLIESARRLASATANDTSYDAYGLRFGWPCRTAAYQSTKVSRSTS